MSYPRGYTPNFPTQSYSPTLVSTQALTYARMVFNETAEQKLELDFFAAYNATSAGGNYTIPMPTGYKIDYTRLPHNNTAFSNQSAMIVGNGQWQDAGTAFKYVNVMVNNASSFIVNENPGILQGTGLSTSDSVKLNIVVPFIYG